LSFVTEPGHALSVSDSSRMHERRGCAMGDRRAERLTRIAMRPRRPSELLNSCDADIQHVARARAYVDRCANGAEPRCLDAAASPVQVKPATEPNASPTSSRDLSGREAPRVVRCSPQQLRHVAMVRGRQSGGGVAGRGERIQERARGAGDELELHEPPAHRGSLWISAKPEFSGLPGRRARGVAWRKTGARRRSEAATAVPDRVDARS